MTGLRAFLSRAGSVFRRRRLDADLDDELRLHLELLAADHVRRGLSPGDARAAAIRDFGGVMQTVEACREQGGLPWLETLRQDARCALRLWQRAPGFSLVVIAVLALGIGANSAMFTFVNALLFRPLPGRAAELVGLYSHDSTQPDSYRSFSYPNYADIRERNDVFEQLAAYTFAMAGRPAGDTMRRTFVEVVSSNFFATVGVTLAAGRTFTADEERPGADIPVAIVPYASWEESGFDPAFIGRTIRVNTRDLTVVGVAPQGFTGTTALLAPEMWLPLGLFNSVVNDIFKNNGRGLNDRANASLVVAGRLKRGIGPAQADAQLARLSSDLERAHPAENARQILTVHSLSRVSISTEPSDDSGPAAVSAVMMPLSGAVLLIACFNIANMLLARGSTRRKEMAIRLALGGSRARIVRQLLTESLMLAAAGAAAGLLLGSWTTRLIMTSLEPMLPLSIRFEWRPDLNIVLVTSAFAVLSVLIFGLGPALKISRLDLVDDLKDVGSARRAGRRLGTRTWLVVCQIAVSLVLMTIGGLFARSALSASASDPGYRYDGLLLASVDANLAAYGEARGRERLRASLGRLRQLPGAAAVGATSQIPFGEFHEGRPVERPGHGGTDRRSATFTIITGGYFAALGLPIVRGRDFSESEEMSATGARVAIVDEPLARQLFANENPIGQPLRVVLRPGEVPSAENEPVTIVGVVPGLRDDLFEREPAPHLYFPFGAYYRATMHIHARVPPGAEAPMLGAVRRELRAVDERLPIVELRTLQDFHNRGLVLWALRAAGRGLSGLGGLALLLAVVGVYGVKSYVVSQRTREIGIRLALGAAPREIAWMLLRDGARLTAIGVAIGFPVAVLAGRLLSSAIVGVSAFDPVVLTAAPLLLAIFAALAAYLPARRGRRVSPLEALRTE